MATIAWTIVQPQLDELEEGLGFVATAHRLRPRLGDVMGTWDAGEATVIAREFMSQKNSQPEGLYSALLVRLLAIFERYLRGLLEHALTSMEKSTARYDDI